MLTHPHDVVVLADVDSTLRDSDRLKAWAPATPRAGPSERAVRALLGDSRGPCGASCVMRTIWARFSVTGSSACVPDLSARCQRHPGPGPWRCIWLTVAVAGNLDQPRDWPKLRASNDVLEAHAQDHQSQSLAAARAWWRAGAQAAAQEPLHERASAMSRTLVLGSLNMDLVVGLSHLPRPRRDRCQRATAGSPGRQGRQSSGRSPHGHQVGRVGSDPRVGTPEVEFAAQSRLRPSAATLSAESVAFFGSVGPIELESIMRDEDLAGLILTVA
jgi:hypothetical protein